MSGWVNASPNKFYLSKGWDMSSLIPQAVNSTSEIRMNNGGKRHGAWKARHGGWLGLKYIF